MKLKGIGSYIKIFLLAFAIIVVYKTFDNLGVIFDVIKSFISIISPVLIGFAIAFLLYPVCNILEKWYGKCKWKFVHNKRRAFSVITIIIAFLLLLSLVISFIVPAIVKSAVDLVGQLPAIYNGIVKIINNLGFEEFDAWSVISSIPLEKVIEKFEFANINKYIKGVASVSSVVVDFVLSLILAVYILLDRDMLKKGVTRIAKLIFKQNTLEVVGEYGKLTCGYMYKYFGCLLVDASVVFALSFILLLILGVQYAPLLALVMGLLNIIPYFGALIAVVTVIIITMVTSSFSKAIITGICLVVLQQIDANIIQPAIVKDSLKIQPFWVLVAILIGGGLFGIVGIIVSVPVMAIILKIADDFITSREQRISK